MIRADLHLHTCFSDGALSPEELLHRVKDAGVGLCSVTDHDGMEGEERAEKAARKEGLSFVRGIEISSYREFGRVHVLGYGCQKNSAYSRFLSERTEGAAIRAEDSLKKANEFYGTNLTMAKVKEFQKEKSAPLHTMHLAAAFAEVLKKGLREVYREAFAFGKPAYSDLCRPSPEDAIGLIHEMEGIAVLAHPGKIKLGLAEKRELLNKLVRLGLDGIECFHTAHTERESADFIAYAKSESLLITGGSDFHSDGNDRKIGKPAFYPDEALLKALCV